jgi:hypothetical protein
MFALSCLETPGPRDRPGRRDDGDRWAMASCIPAGCSCRAGTGGDRGSRVADASVAAARRGRGAGAPLLDGRRPGRGLIVHHQRFLTVEPDRVPTEHALPDPGLRRAEAADVDGAGRAGRPAARRRPVRPRPGRAGLRGYRDRMARSVEQGLVWVVGPGRGPGLQGRAVRVVARWGCSSPGSSCGRRRGGGARRRGRPRRCARRCGGPGVGRCVAARPRRQHAGAARLRDRGLRRPRGVAAGRSARESAPWSERSWRVSGPRAGDRRRVRSRWRPRPRDPCRRRARWRMEVVAADRQHATVVVAPLDLDPAGVPRDRGDTSVGSAGSRVRSRQTRGRSFVAAARRPTPRGSVGEQVAQRHAVEVGQSGQFAIEMARSPRVVGGGHVGPATDVKIKPARGPGHRHASTRASRPPLHSGLVIPDTAKEKPQQGTVVAVGPGKRSDTTGERHPARRERGRHRPVLHEVRRHRGQGRGRGVPGHPHRPRHPRRRPG